MCRIRLGYFNQDGTAKVGRKPDKLIQLGTLIPIRVLADLRVLSAASGFSIQQIVSDCLIYSLKRVKVERGLSFKDLD